MEKDLAWAVLGVDPAVAKNLTHLASRQGVSLGRCIEMMIHTVSVAEVRGLNKQKQLRSLVAEMADCLMEASDLLNDHQESGTSATKPTAPEIRQKDNVSEFTGSRKGNDQQEPESPNPAAANRRWFQRSA
jgi:hypothetical protein